MGKPLQYADDRKVVYSLFPQELKNMLKCINMKLDKIAKWCLKWQLELDMDKCGWICFSNTSLNTDLTINGKVLCKVTFSNELRIQVILQFILLRTSLETDLQVLIPSDLHSL